MTPADVNADMTIRYDMLRQRDQVNASPMSVYKNNAYIRRNSVYQKEPLSAAMLKNISPESK